MVARSVATLTLALALVVGACSPPAEVGPAPVAGPPGRALEPSSSPSPSAPASRPASKPPESRPRPERRPAATRPEAKPSSKKARVPRAFAGVLAAHNDYRARHCAPPLVWSRELAEVAQGWADTLKFNRCAFEHSTSRYGENLAYFMPKSSGERATRGWYDEVSLYKFSRPGFDMRTGHFTQVVWRDTKRLGCGVAECNGGQIWVCNYDPPGNVEGLYRQNVLPKSCR